MFPGGESSRDTQSPPVTAESLVPWTAGNQPSSPSRRYVAERGHRPRKRHGPLSSRAVSPGDRPRKQVFWPV